MRPGSYVLQNSYMKLIPHVSETPGYYAPPSAGHQSCLSSVYSTVSRWHFYGVALQSTAIGGCMFSRERTATFWRMSWRSRQPCSDTVSLSLFFFFFWNLAQTRLMEEGSLFVLCLAASEGWGEIVVDDPKSRGQIVIFHVTPKWVSKNPSQPGHRKLRDSLHK